MLNLEYFFFLKKTYKCSEIASSCYVSSMYFEINFQNDSSSYVLFWRYIYSYKSGRLALNWILSICCFCVDKASWNSSEISGLVNQWVFQYGKKIWWFQNDIANIFLQKHGAIC